MTLSKQQKKYATYAAVGGVGLLALYFLTLRGNNQATDQSGSGGGGGWGFQLPGNNGQSLLERIMEPVTSGSAQIVTGVAEVPGVLALDTAKKVVTTNEARVSTEVFGGVAKSNVPGFLATGGAGKVFTQPVTYQQYMEAQPIVFRGAVAAGNVITGNQAAEYGKYASEETKKAMVAAGQSSEDIDRRLASLDPVSQTLVALGNVLTVPFGGGGASGWGASYASWQSNLVKKVGFGWTPFT